MARLDDFIQSWLQADHFDNLVPAQLCTTAFGNINSTGEIGNYAGKALSPWHPQFYASLEAGVRELILTCVQNLNWITYTSCEGHCYDGQAEQPVERHVGILPRDDVEYAVIYSILGPIAQRFNQRHSLSTARIDLDECMLHSETCSRRVIDLFFRKKPLATWPAYFRVLNRYTVWLILELRRASARTTTGNYDGLAREMDRANEGQNGSSYQELEWLKWLL